MNRDLIIENAIQYVKHELGEDASGHDWWHIYRVWNMAKFLAEKEDATIFICELAALLHDIADEKLNESEEAGLQKVSKWLADQEIETDIEQAVMEIISTMSFKGGNRPSMSTLEGKVVQDADRLDAIGAIGVARTFAYAGAHGDLIYDPTIPPRTKISKEQYRNEKSTAVNHFYEKLLKLTDLMNTAEAKRIAEERHRFMERFLEQFDLEWNGPLLGVSSKKEG